MFVVQLEDAELAVDLNIELALCPCARGLHKPTETIGFPPSLFVWDDTGSPSQPCKETNRCQTGRFAMCVYTRTLVCMNLGVPRFRG